MIFSKKVIFETQFTRICVSWKTHASFSGHSNLHIPSFLMIPCSIIKLNNTLVQLTDVAMGITFKKNMA